MSTVISFTYSQILIILYVVVASMFAALNFLKKRRLAMPVILLFTVYVVDSYIIMLTERIGIFTTWYNNVFYDSPVIKTCMFLGYAACVMAVWNALVRSKFSPVQILILIVFGLYLVVEPLIGKSAVQVWAYFEGWSVLSIIFSLYGLWKLKKMKEESDELSITTLKTVLIVTIILSVCIMLEDYFVIFNIDTYTPSYVYMQSRCYSEDALRVFYAAVCIRLFSRQFRLQWFTAPEDVSIVTKAKDRKADDKAEANVSPASEIVKSPEQIKQEHRLHEYKTMKYGRYIGLTEREMRIFSEIAKKKNNQEIADDLSVSLGTVKAHVHNIFVKANVSKRSELLMDYEKFDPNEDDLDM